MHTHDHDGGQSATLPITKPVYREILADLETPLTAFLKVGGQPAFLLESVEQGERVARYSFIGSGERRRVEARAGQVTVSGPAGSHTFASADPLSVLWQETVRPSQGVPGLPEFWAGMVGYASYDLVRSYENLPDGNPDELGIPDLLFIEPEVLVAFDHFRRRIFVIAQAVAGDADDERRAGERVDQTVARLRAPLPGVPGDRAGVLTPFTANFSRSEFEAAVSRAVEYIRAGDVFQVVPSLRLSADLGVHPLALYRALRMVNPSPYLGYLDLGPVTLVASSPESLVRSDGVTVSTRPIAGTRPRGATPEEDERLAEELLADPKERSEHVMLVDLSRNDLGRVCEFGSVEVHNAMRIERFSHVMHIVSDVQGRLAEGRTPLDALAATLPMGTASGAPKVRAMEIIDELEPVRRGAYAGAFGYLSVQGDMDMALTLRTATITGGRIHLQAGVGVVADSQPELEFEEAVNKLKALQKAVEMAVEGLR